MILTLWQLVGIWRSADKHVQRGGKANWAGVAKVMVVLGILRVVGDLSTQIAKEANDEVRQTLRTRGVPDSFINRALSTSPKDMWYPSKDELLSANVIDSVVDSRYFGLSGVTQWRDAHQIEEGILAISVYSALAQYDQKNYARLRNILVAGIQKGQSQIEIQNNMRAIVGGELIPAYLKKAPDDALVRYWRSQIAEMSHLANLNPQHCVDFAYPQLAKSPPDLQRLLTRDLQTEDLDALAAVVKGVAMNPQGNGSSTTIQADIKAAMMKVAQKYPWAMGVVQNPGGHKDNPTLLCGAIIAIYSEVLAIPSNSRSGPILRYMLSE